MTEETTQTDHNTADERAEESAATTTPRPRRRRAASRPVGSPSVELPPPVTEVPPAPAITDSAAGDVDRPGIDPVVTDDAAGAEPAAVDTAAVDTAPLDTATVDTATVDTAAVDAAPAEAVAPDPEAQSAESALSGEPEAAAPEPPAEPEARPVRRARRRAAPAVMFQEPDPVAVTPAPRDEEPKDAPSGPPAEPTAADAESAGADQTGDEADSDGEDTNEGGDTAPRRRRRRGRRGRGRARDDDETTGENGSAESADGDGEAPASAEASADDSAGNTDSDEAEGSDSGEGGESASVRRRRTRRRPPRAAQGGDDDSQRDGRSSDDEIRGVNGSTRLEAKRQRRRESRDTSRRRVPVVTEAEWLARRESVNRVMVVRNAGERTQIAVLEDGVLVEHYVTRASSASYAGNVYLGRVQNVLPSMEAAFVDIGKGRNGVLYAGEVNYDASGLEGKPRKIEQALKAGQAVVVQVTKDPIAHKGARLTSQVSLPGRYMVYVPDGGSAGISRKLPDSERTRLRGILKKITPEDAGVIVRTAAEGASEDELSRDIERLASQWEDIQKKAAKGSPPSLLYGEPDLVIRVIRDIFNEDFSELVIQGDREWELIENYVSQVAPDLVPRLRRETEGDVFAESRIDEQLLKALERKVYLPSGGSLVFDRTEAMTVVDVNTGRFTGKGGNLEETVTKNNLEAAEELVRQLRLRDVGGIIVVDFIDMVLESNRELVLRRLTECLGRDRTKHQVAEVTSLGLVQMTRKRVGQGLLEAYSEPCPTCGGRGQIIDLPGLGGAKPKPKPIPRRPVPRTNGVDGDPDAEAAEGADPGAAEVAPNGAAAADSAEAMADAEEAAADAVDADEVAEIADEVAEVAEEVAEVAETVAAEAEAEAVRDSEATDDDSAETLAEQVAD